jgi:hypothetical protein
MANKNKTESEKSKSDVDTPAKLFDVASPGKTPASSTSRPIIVKHGSMVARDPMVVKDEENKSAESESAKTVGRELKLEPVAEPEVIETAETDTNSAEKVDESAPEDNTDVSDEVTETGAGAVDTLINEVDAKQADKKQKKEFEERMAELEKSIESKEFFVPIGVASHRRSKRRLIGLMILILLLGLAGLNFAVDAEVIEIGVQAFTDLL